MSYQCTNRAFSPKGSTKFSQCNDHISNDTFNLDSKFGPSTKENGDIRLCVDLWNLNQA